MKEGQILNRVNVELIFTGNELLIGKTLNTNSQWLAKRIYSLGAQVTRMVCVSDTLEDISKKDYEVFIRNSWNACNSSLVGC